MQDHNPLKDVDLISALHNDSENKLASLLIDYLDEAFKYIEVGSKEMAPEYQGYLNHLCSSISKARFLLAEMAEFGDDGDDD